MKHFLLLLASIYLSINLSAQSFSGILKYKTTVSTQKKLDESGDIDSFQNRLALSVNVNMPYTQSFFINQDSLYAEKHYSSYSGPYELIGQSWSEGVSINSETGRKKSVKYFRPEIPEHLFKRVKKNAETIQGIKSECYHAENNFFSVKIWIAQDDFQLNKEKFFTLINFKGHLILKKQVLYKNNKNTKTTVLESFSKETPNSLASKISAIDKISDENSMYAEFKENEKYESTELALGTTAPNLRIRMVNDFKEKYLYSHKGNGKFTLLEFWGTWCGPCLTATPKLKAFYEKNKESVDLISFNCMDHRSDYVKKMIKHKGMNWQHAYGTERLINILNPLKRFPTIVLLNDNMEVLLIGSPHKDLEKIEKIIGDKKIVTKLKDLRLFFPLFTCSLYKIYQSLSLESKRNPDVIRNISPISSI